MITLVGTSHFKLYVFFGEVNNDWRVCSTTCCQWMNHDRQRAGWPISCVGFSDAFLQLSLSIFQWDRQRALLLWWLPPSSREGRVGCFRSAAQRKATFFGQLQFISSNHPPAIIFKGMNHRSRQNDATHPTKRGLSVSNFQKNSFKWEMCQMVEIT